MERSSMFPLSSTPAESSDALLNGLSTEQHIHPHESVAEALEAARQKIGFCPLAGENALRWLQIDGATTIGRLRRTELMQLSRCIYRFWREAVPAAGGTLH